MDTDLPDINVWLALVDENHSLHAAAAAYWNDPSTPKRAFCRITILGFLRLSSSPRVLSRKLTHAEAWQTYLAFLRLPEIVSLPEPANLDLTFHKLSSPASIPHHLWTDAYLAALAMQTKSRIVSFDKDFTRFPKLAFLHLRP